MFFKNKKNKTEKCESCGSGVKGDFRYCPSCGNSLIDPEKEQKDFGMLGKTDLTEEDMPQDQFAQFGITDKFLGNLVNNLMKSLDKQFRGGEKEFNNTEVRSFPNGIKIRIGQPQQNKNQKKAVRRSPVSESQIEKMAKLPRGEAKTSIKRLGDKVVYELNTPGISSKEDVFISKVESGYEVKAIGNKKVYVNNLPLNLPLRKFSILKNKLLVEFNTQE